MENTRAAKGISEILAKFEDAELFNLASTVTQGLLKNKLENREDAIKAIVKYSTDIETFLKRKVVTRDCLFLYLHDNKVNVKIPITKDKLIEKVLKLWKPRDKERSESRHRKKAIEYKENSATDSQHSTNTPDCNNLPSISNGEQLHPGATESNNKNLMQVNNGTLEHEVAARTEIDIMAEEFAKWFYNMMNQNEAMGTEHFYPDAHLKIKLINNQMCIEEEALNNIQDIVNLLFKVKTEHNLFFNPNLSKDGTKGKKNPHGLVVIVSCGTLHINYIISGVFEQQFALARDPFSENNWKVKYTELILRSRSDVTQQPILGENDTLQLETSVRTRQVCNTSQLGITDSTVQLHTTDSMLEVANNLQLERTDYSLEVVDNT